MARSRRCCCCQDLYASINGPNLMRTANGKAYYFAVNSAANNVTSRQYYDFVNRQVFQFWGSGTTKTHIARAPADLSGLTQVFAIPAGLAALDGLAANPRTQKLYYACRDSPIYANFRLRQVAYDGSGDVEIVTRTEATATGVTLYSMRLSDNYLFYGNVYALSPSGFYAQLRRCDLDGANDVAIWTATGNGPTVIAVDNTHGWVYWSRAALRTILRSNFDGGDLQTFFDASSHIPPLPEVSGRNYAIHVTGYSHARGRLFFSAGTIGTLSATLSAGLGIYSIAADGTDLRPEYVDPNLLGCGSLAAGIGGAVVNHQIQTFHPFALGCGFETTGASTLAT